jgi:hypothetical protein
MNILFTDLDENFLQYKVTANITNETAYSVLLHTRGAASYGSIGEKLKQQLSINEENIFYFI